MSGTAPDDTDPEDAGPERVWRSAVRNCTSTPGMPLNAPGVMRRSGRASNTGRSRRRYHSAIRGRLVADRAEGSSGRAQFARRVNPPPARTSQPSIHADSTPGQASAAACSTARISLLRTGFADSSRIEVMASCGIDSVTPSRSSCRGSPVRGSPAATRMPVTSDRAARGSPRQSAGVASPSRYRTTTRSPMNRPGAASVTGCARQSSWPKGSSTSPGVQVRPGTPHLFFLMAFLAARALRPTRTST